MLPPYLNNLKKFLETKGIVKRTLQEDEVLRELEAVDKDLDHRDIAESTKASEKYARFNPGVLGPDPRRCPICGK